MDVGSTSATRKVITEASSAKGAVAPREDACGDALWLAIAPLLESFDVSVSFEPLEAFSEVVLELLTVALHRRVAQRPRRHVHELHDASQAAKASPTTRPRVWCSSEASAGS